MYQLTVRQYLKNYDIKTRYKKAHGKTTKLIFCGKITTELSLLWLIPEPELHNPGRAPKTSVHSVRLQYFISVMA